MSLAKISLRGKVKVKAIAVLNIFSFVNIGERVGSGYPFYKRRELPYSWSLWYVQFWCN